LNHTVNEDYFEKLNFSEAPRVTVAPPGPKARDLLNRQAKVDSQVLTYPAMVPLAPDKGLGATLKDVDGNCFIDLSGGVGVLNVGHSHPDITAAIKEQADKLVHGLDFPGEARVQMSEKMAAIAPEGLKNNCKVFLCAPTGTDAVESATKLAKYNSKKPTIIAFEGGWHGVTGAGLATSGKKGIRKDFLPVMPEVYHAPYAYCYRCAFGKTYPSCDLQCARFLEHAIKDPDGSANDPGCVIIEPIQGEGGIVIPPDEYLKEVRRICDEYGLILIMDEIQTGFGRTGSMFACDRLGITPDIVTASKTMGGGLPVASILFKKELDTWKPGAHVGTFRGNSLSCASGLAAINVIEDTGLCERSARLGASALERLKAIADKSRFIGDVRGKGLFIGMEFVHDKKTKAPAPELLQKTVSKCFQEGVMLWKSGRWNNVGRMMPALVITEGLLDTAIDIFEEAYYAIEKES